MKKEKIVGWILIISVFLITMGTMFFLVGLKGKKTFPRDEKMQIVFLGDSNVAFRRDDTDIPELVAEKLNVTTYNCALGGTAASRLDGRNSFDSYYERCCLYELSNMILAQEMIPARDNLEFIVNEYETADNKLNLLMDMDFSKVDYIILNYGMNDYLMGVPTDNPMDLYDDGTYAGAMREMITNFHKEFPGMKFVVCSITYFYTEDCLEDCGKDFGGGNLFDYRDAARIVAEDCENTFFLDNLTLLGINHDNWQDNMSDIMHLNEKTQELYATYLADYIREIETEKND